MLIFLLIRQSVTIALLPHPKCRRAHANTWNLTNKHSWQMASCSQSLDQAASIMQSSSGGVDPIIAHAAHVTPTPGVIRRLPVADWEPQVAYGQGQKEGHAPLFLHRDDKITQLHSPYTVPRSQIPGYLEMAHQTSDRNSEDAGRNLHSNWCSMITIIVWTDNHTLSI